jgi:hypothetical protein
MIIQYVEIFFILSHYTGSLFVFHFIKGSLEQKGNNFIDDIFHSVNQRIRRIKTAPAKEGDATRAVCKENSFTILIGNIYTQVNHYRDF